MNNLNILATAAGIQTSTPVRHTQDMNRAQEALHDCASRVSLAKGAPIARQRGTAEEITQLMTVHI